MRSEARLRQKYKKIPTRLELDFVWVVAQLFKFVYLDGRNRQSFMPKNLRVTAPEDL